MKIEIVQLTRWLLLFVTVIVVCPPWLPVIQAQTTAASGNSNMVWVSTSNSTALCNDFTQAGFFIRQNLSSKNWVVYLESGGLCYNTESCNRRFFVRKVFNYLCIGDHCHIFVIWELCCTYKLCDCSIEESSFSIPLAARRRSHRHLLLANSVPSLKTITMNFIGVDLWSVCMGEPLL